MSFPVTPTEHVGDTASAPTRRTRRQGDGAHDEPSFRSAAMTAGLGILLVAVLAGFGSLVATSGLVTPDDAGRTAHDVSGSETLFRLGVVSLILTAIIDIVVAWGLCQVFRSTSPGLSRLAAWFRLAYAATLLVAVSQLLGAIRLLHQQAQDAAFTAGQLQSQALSDFNAFDDIFTVGLVLFGAHLLLVGYLGHRADFIPGYLAALICLAGAGYAFDGMAAVLSSGSLPEITPFTFIGEPALALWLVVRGRHLFHDETDPEPLA